MAVETDDDEKQVARIEVAYKACAEVIASMDEAEAGMVIANLMAAIGSQCAGWTIPRLTAAMVEAMAIGIEMPAAAFLGEVAMILTAKLAADGDPIAIAQLDKMRRSTEPAPRSPGRRLVHVGRRFARRR